MEKVEASLDIEVNCECPYCEEYLNLLDYQKFEDLNEDGYLQRKVLKKDGYGNSNLSEEIKCPACEKEFLLTSVWW